jgi:hypothetical protein
MTQENKGRFSFRAMTLRNQLTLGCLSLSVLIGVTGASGLFFANDIGTTVEGFSELAGPLTAESSSLAQSTDAARIDLLEVLEQGAQSDLEAKRSEMTALGARSTEGLERLSGMVRFPSI